MTSGMNNATITITDTTASGSNWYGHAVDDTTWISNGIWHDGTGTADNTTYHHHVWGPPSPSWPPSTPTDIDWLEDLIEKAWKPIECTCCGRDVKVQDDGLHLKIGDETLWFHRQCFVNRKYAKFIRSLIVTKDLGIL